MQKYVLTKIHEGHQGVTKSRERAKMAVFWIGISKDIEDFVNRCTYCQQHQRNQSRLPLISTPLPERPWQYIAADIADYNNQQYLITVDYFSRYIEIDRLKSMTSSSVITVLKNLFARWGIPASLKTDNGTQFTAEEFRKFTQDWDFTHTTSSPHHPQSNGEAERAVATAKAILKQPDVQMALLSYRSTPIPSLGYSPAQMIMGRNIRTTLPTLNARLNPKWPSLKDIQKSDALAKRRNEENTGGQDLKPLTVGQQVRMKLDNEKHWSEPATVLRTHGPRSYVIQTSNGMTLRRHRRHLRTFKPMQLLADPTVSNHRNADPSPSPTEATHRRPERARKKPVRLDL